MALLNPGYCAVLFVDVVHRCDSTECLKNKTGMPVTFGCETDHKLRGLQEEFCYKF